jgi:hydrogenase maturation protease
MNHPRILIAGVGNIFLGDDAFGVEVVRRMARRTLPAAVRVIDFGIKGIDLAYALLEGCDGAILVDAVSRGGEPGMLYVLEPDLDNMEDTGAGGQVVEAHGMDPVEVFRLVRTLGGPLPTIRVVGCEPATFAPADGRTGLSAPVDAAVGGAITLIEALTREWLDRKQGWTEAAESSSWSGPS